LPKESPGWKLRSHLRFRTTRAASQRIAFPHFVFAGLLFSFQRATDLSVGGTGLLLNPPPGVKNFFRFIFDRATQPPVDLRHSCTCHCEPSRSARRDSTLRVRS